MEVSMLEFFKLDMQKMHMNLKFAPMLTSASQSYAMRRTTGVIFA